MIEPRPDVGCEQETWPRFFDSEIVEDGQVLLVTLREFDGSYTLARINIGQLAD